MARSPVTTPHGPERRVRHTRAVVSGLLLALLVFWLPEANRSLARSPAIATGTVEGTVSMPAAAPARTAERYIGTDGSTRDIPAIPVVVYVQGLVQAPARPSSPPRLAQRDETFHPQLLVVPLGATVAFPNDDPVFHNVFSYSRARRFDLGRYRRGESKDVQFDRPGYVKVMCEVHKWMRAGILVVENPFYAIVPDTGRFRIEGLPPGRHRLAAEHFDRRTVTLDVDVTAGGTAQLQVRF